LLTQDGTTVKVASAGKHRDGPIALSVSIGEWPALRTPTPAETAA
jgi:hypothetical protein